VTIVLSFLANHVWQSTLFAFLVVLLPLALKNNRAETRFWLVLTASLKFLIPFSLLAGIGTFVPAPRKLPPVIQAGMSAAIEPFGSSRVVVNHTADTPVAKNTWKWAIWWPIALIGIWLCGIVFITVLSWRRSRRVAAIAGKAKRLVEGPEVEITERLSRGFGFERPIPILESTATVEPGLFRVFDPVLLLPANIGRHLDTLQLEAIIAHELSHARRRDNLWSTAHRIVETLFWFHPLVWWIGKRLVDERERACDEDVLQQGCEREVYAQAMVKVCEFCISARFDCIAGIRGSDLKARIEAVMMNRTSLKLSYPKKALLATGAILSILSVVLAGSMRHPQAAAPLTFEAASVKPASPRSGLTWGSCHGTDSSGAGGWIASRILPGMSRPAPSALGRCVITAATLKQIVSEAYDLAPTVEIAGGPSWFDSDRFDIDAKAEDPSKTTDAQLQQMLQQLLADRFKLKLHRENKEVSGSLLVVDKNGSKLKEVTDAVNVPARGGRPGDMNFRAAHIGVLAEFLSGIMGRPVQDKTGLTGRYTFDLKWALGENDVVPPEFAQPKDHAGPSLVTALQEQLGLRLQSGRVPILIVVVDSAEKALPN
jgi:bla regulator protein BlaR1